ncbi:NAD(+)/NADH kinase [Aurantiacibacter aquimixticola]|uniref:Sugar kinase n=1 Tax=Aurantiacibacter aquimixticola TaxID=1958945 RepID=A0A419RT66_9SPHN|nr:NAD(+)/NADH kinase [Aurantiacibacter aquimixticola]RJY08970.1 hypothetical protein D6201_05975 [Aurantiacibacter aquimixticola]
MGALPPRAVFVTRPTEYESLIARHATRDQARFFLQQRGQDLAEVEARHERQEAALSAAHAALPDEWRHADVPRADLDRFLFTPEDVIVAVGQDGLVPNVAKYLDGQKVIGVNPDPDRYDGVLVRFRAQQLASLYIRAWHGDAEVERRTMAEGRLDNGDRLVALNELFIGHRTHQSARYLIEDGAAREEQSSSGLIVATGTGATGWARSIMIATGAAVELAPTQTALGWFVREPFPSVSTGIAMKHGTLGGKPLTLTSRMNDGGVVFADGMEADFLNFGWGRRLEVGVAKERLHLVTS